MLRPTIDRTTGKLTEVAAGTFHSGMRRLFCLMAVCTSVLAAEYSAPAGSRPAIRRPGSPSIIPGGRIVAPTGRQYITGPGPFGLAISPDSKTIV